jgi:hypothetical protein
MGRPKINSEEDKKAKAYERLRKWRLNNPDKLAAQTAKRRSTYGEKERATSREWYKKNPDKVKEKIWPNNLRRFGMSVDEYLALLESQDGKCAICGELPKDGKRRFAVDHCHKTLVVRGLLCMSCNIGIGQFYDRTDLLLSAVAYLETPREAKFKLPRPIPPRNGRKGKHDTKH